MEADKAYAESLLPLLYILRGTGAMVLLRGLIIIKAAGGIVSKHNHLCGHEND